MRLAVFRRLPVGFMPGRLHARSGTESRRRTVQLGVPLRLAVALVALIGTAMLAIAIAIAIAEFRKTE